MTLKIDSARLRELQAAAPHAKFDRQAQLAQRLYDQPYGRELSTFRHRMETHFRDDREAVGKIRASIPQLEAFGAKRGMTGSDMQALLSRVHEYVQFPRDQATQDKIAENSFEAMRLARGSREQAEAAVQRHNKFMDGLRAEVPEIGKLASDCGARVDRQFIELGARCSETK